MIVGGQPRSAQTPSDRSLIPLETVAPLVEESESVKEHAAIRAINEAAFGGSEEADLVDRLRTDGNAIISLVAEMQNRLVGHILFSRMGIETQAGLVAAVALAP